jgi:hypothetical protein
MGAMDQPHAHRHGPALISGSDTVPGTSPPSQVLTLRTRGLRDVATANTYREVDPVWEPYLMVYNDQLIAAPGRRQIQGPGRIRVGDGRLHR